MKWQDVITFNTEIRFGKPCIRGTRLAVVDILEYLSSGMSIDEIIIDFPELTRDDILACLAYAVDREKNVFAA